MELAAVAQHYSEQCVFEHNPHRSAQAEQFPYVGENIAITNNPVANYTALVGGWYSERQYYDVTTDQCVGKECRHYTQVGIFIHCIKSFRRTCEYSCIYTMRAMSSGGSRVVPEVPRPRPFFNNSFF